MRRVRCPAPLFVAVVDKVNFEIFTIYEDGMVTIAVIKDDIGYQIEAGVVMSFEWRGNTDRMCDAAIRHHLKQGV